LWEANTIQIPKTLIIQELAQEIPDGSILALAACLMNPTTPAGTLQTQYDISNEAMDVAGSFLYGPQKSNTNPNPKNPGSATPPSVTTICSKMSEAFPNIVCDESQVKSFLMTCNSKRITLTEELLDDLITVSVDVDTRVKPVDSPFGFFVYLLNKRGIESVQSQASAIRSKGNTSESILRRTMREAEKQLETLELPAPQDQAAALRRMREAMGGNPQSSS
jgi:hypothetical protein